MMKQQESAQSKMAAGNGPVGSKSSNLEFSMERNKAELMILFSH